MSGELECGLCGFAGPTGALGGLGCGRHRLCGECRRSLGFVHPDDDFCPRCPLGADDAEDAEDGSQAASDDDHSSTDPEGPEESSSSEEEEAEKDEDPLLGAFAKLHLEAAKFNARDKAKATAKLDAFLQRLEARLLERLRSTGDDRLRRLPSHKTLFKLLKARLREEPKEEAKAPAQPPAATPAPRPATQRKGKSAKKPKPQAKKCAPEPAVAPQPGCSSGQAPAKPPKPSEVERVESKGRFDPPLGQGHRLAALSCDMEKGWQLEVLDLETGRGSVDKLEKELQVNAVLSQFVPRPGGRVSVLGGIGFTHEGSVHQCAGEQPTYTVHLAALSVKKGPAIPGRVFEPTVAGQGERIFALGGYVQGQEQVEAQRTTAAWLQEAEDAPWRRIARLKRTRQQALAAADERQLFLLGGERAPLCPVAERYDVGSDRWLSLKAPSGWDASGSAALFAHGRLVVVGGRQSEAFKHDHAGRDSRAACHLADGCRKQRLESVLFEPTRESLLATAPTLLYDPREGRWSHGPSTIRHRETQHGLFLHRGRVHVAGGLYESGQELLGKAAKREARLMERTMEVLDERQGRWTTLPHVLKHSATNAGLLIV